MKKNVLKMVAAVVIAALMVVFDQLTKVWAVQTLKNAADIIIIPKVFRLHYLENAGMAFGIMQNKQIFFYIVTVIILALILFYLWRMPITKRFIPLFTVMSIVSGGAVGNLIDRVSNKYVVDFFYFELINFPIFNVADICVSLGCITLIILLCFVYKDDELKPIFRIKKKQ